MEWRAIFLLLALTASPCFADKAFWAGAGLPPREARMAQAREWRDGFRRLDQQIPTLSPTEAVWLKREYDDQFVSSGGTYTSRALAASDSTEYHKRIARERLDSA